MNTPSTIDTIIMPDDPRWLSAESCCFGRFASERFAAVQRPALTTRAVKRAAGHVRVQALKQRQAKQREIATRPRGQTEIVGRHEDGSPIYRAIPAFRTRPYTPPADRKERPEPTIEAVNGWRYNVRPTAERIAAALKAEARHNALSSHRVLADLVDGDDDRRRFLGIAASRVAKRAARKAANRRKARRGWR